MSRIRVEIITNKTPGLTHLGTGNMEFAGNLHKAMLTQPGQIITNQALSQWLGIALLAEPAKLNKQALAQVTRANSWRVQRLKQAKHMLHTLHIHPQHLRNFLN